MKKQKIKDIFQKWLIWIGYTIKKVKPRKHYSRPTKVQKVKKGKGSYKRTKKVNLDG